MTLEKLDFQPDFGMNETLRIRLVRMRKKCYKNLSCLFKSSRFLYSQSLRLIMDTETYV